MPENISLSLPSSPTARCFCAQVRRLSRKLSSLYDTVLAPENLTITQYSLLVNIDRAGTVSHAALAEKIGIERTTLTRNLLPLTKARWISVTKGDDRRQHLLHLTSAGKGKLMRSFPLWEEAQRQFISQLGQMAQEEFRDLLTAVERAAGKAIDQPAKRPIPSPSRKEPTHATRSHRPDQR